MIRRITGTPIISTQIGVREDVPETFYILVDCVTNYRLYATVNAEVLVEGRRQGDVPWINLETSEISLTPWNGTQQIFEIRTTRSDPITVRDFTDYTVSVRL
jgi:hypothetical protein